MRQAGTNLPKVGQYNQAVVMGLIQSAADGVSRVEIAQHTGLTQQAVSIIVRRLLDDGVVREDGVSRDTGARRPRQLLRVNANARCAVGLHLDPVELSCAVVNLRGEPVTVLRRPLSASADPETVIATMTETVGEAVAAARIPVDRLLGVGVAAPGPIDHDLGTVLSPPQLAHWQRVPIARRLQDHLGMPVTLENDATAAAIAERWAGGGRGVSDFAYVFLGTGIGGGLILGHQVYRGGSRNAGEFGHTTIATDGPDCYCGNRGCLERLVSPAAIVGEASRRLDAGADSVLSAPYRADAASLTYAAVCAAALAADPLATEVVDAAAELLASVVVGMVNVLDIELVILGGHALRLIGPRVREVVAEAVRTRPIARQLRVAEVQLSELGADAAVIGAAALVLHATYSPHLTTLLA